jgi:predicted O-methyltransferase YrrM
MNEHFDGAAVKPSIPYGVARALAAGHSFHMNIDARVGALIRLLVATRPGANILEIGTGAAVGSSWILAGMDDKSHLDTIENDPELVANARKLLEKNHQVNVIEADADVFLRSCRNESYDFVFSDAGPGKYWSFDLALRLLRSSGLLLMDDMNPIDGTTVRSETYGEGQQFASNAERARLTEDLQGRSDLILVELDYATGVFLIAKKGNR